MMRRSVRPSSSAQVTVAALAPCISTASTSTGPDAASPDTYVPGVSEPKIGHWWRRSRHDPSDNLAGRRDRRSDVGLAAPPQMEAVQPTAPAGPAEYGPPPDAVRARPLAVHARTIRAGNLVLVNRRSGECVFHLERFRSQRGVRALVHARAA
jgi:hypothetical protein